MRASLVKLTETTDPHADTGSRLGCDLGGPQISENSRQSWYRDGPDLRPVRELSSWPVLTSI